MALESKGYAYLLEGDDLSPEQQRELLETLWSLMVAFVDLGFGVNAIEALIPELAQAKQDQTETNKGAKSTEAVLCSDITKHNKL